MNGAIEKAKEMSESYLMPGYRFNLTIPANIEIHKTHQKL
jgi:hypothetical protein